MVLLKALYTSPLADLSIFHLDFFGKHSAMLQLLHEDYSFTLSVTRYSFIQLSELWQRGVNKNNIVMMIICAGYDAVLSLQEKQQRRQQRNLRRRRRKTSTVRVGPETQTPLWRRVWTEPWIIQLQVNNTNQQNWQKCRRLSENMLTTCEAFISKMSSIHFINIIIMFSVELC